MEWKKEWRKLALMIGIFLACFYLPVGGERFNAAVLEALRLVRWYAREHVLFCLIPAFFIAGAVSVFISRASVVKYLGAGAHKVLAYGVASISGTILAVCSCTVLPLFAGIYRMGAGLGPATAFLYSGPAINVLAIALTTRVLGPKLGVARAIGAILFSIVIGLLMHLIFRRENREQEDGRITLSDPETARPLWQNAIYFAIMIAILIFANWGAPMEPTGLWHAIYTAKWPLTALFSAVLAVLVVLWFGVKPWKMLFAAAPAAGLAFAFPQHPALPFAAGVVGLSALASTSRGETGEWFAASWGFAKQILPLLLAGVVAAGLLLGSPEHAQGGLIPADWVAQLVGGNSPGANLFASVAGAFMYFATLTEVPILQGLIRNGMGDGPALALLLAGPALSLPNMLVIHSVMGTRKTITFVLLVVVMATISGMLFGALT
ncbi:permease [Kiritimatiella glycovorans]|uniref:permease n=1 Tax=Kiritimatiella glycovorans TaxID=1307763 RepID=UPI00069999FB